LNWVIWALPDDGNILSPIRWVCFNIRLCTKHRKPITFLVTQDSQSFLNLMRVAIFSVTTLHFIPSDCKRIKVKYRTHTCTYCTHTHMYILYTHTRTYCTHTCTYCNTHVHTIHTHVHTVQTHVHTHVHTVHTHVHFRSIVRNFKLLYNYNINFFHIKISRVSIKLHRTRCSTDALSCSCILHVKEYVVWYYWNFITLLVRIRYWKYGPI
jgi:hypothetical protein